MSDKAAAKERVLSIDNNRDALIWRLRLIEAAQEQIVLSTFDFRDDNSGQDIMAALLNAADRTAYILGGRNTNDLFLGNYKDSYNEDRDILVYEISSGEGGSYRQLKEYSGQIWNLPCCKKFEKYGADETYLRNHYKKVKEKYPEAFGETEWEKVTIEADGVELCTNLVEPENKWPKLWNRLTAEMAKERDILIQTPYVICSRDMYQDLSDICSGGTKVELIINAVESGANPFGCTDYLNQKKNVRKTGMCTYEYAGGQALHTKTILAGENTSIVGSCNLDMRSIYLDTEMMLIIDSPKLNALLRGQAKELKAKSKEVLPDGTTTEGEAYQPVKQGAAKKIFYGVLRVLTIPFRHLL